jgi:hypothetical protein
MKGQVRAPEAHGLKVWEAGGITGGKVGGGVEADGAADAALVCVEPDAGEESIYRQGPLRKPLRP